eukprot:3032724-Rhodomonas_salina.1
MASVGEMLWQSLLFVFSPVRRAIVGIRDYFDEYNHQQRKFPHVVVGKHNSDSTQTGAKHTLCCMRSP